MYTILLLLCRCIRVSLSHSVYSIDCIDYIDCDDLTYFYYLSNGLKYGKLGMAPSKADPDVQAAFIKREVKSHLKEVEAGKHMVSTL